MATCTHTYIHIYNIHTHTYIYIYFLDVSCSVKDDYLIFDIYDKPTHSFSYLRYRSCHPRHTKNNVALSLVQRIICIASDNKETYLNKLKSCLIQRGHPEEVLNFTMSKLFSPTVKNQDESIDIVTFIHTYNPNVKFNKNIINESLNNFSDRSLKDTFLNKKPLVATRQGKNLQTLLTKARFDLVQRPTLSVRNNGLYTCQDNRCLLHKNNYIIPCTEFKFKLKSGRYFTWKYNRYYDNIHDYL